MTQIRQMTTDELFIATIICGHLSYLCHLCAPPQLPHLHHFFHPPFFVINK